MCVIYCSLDRAKDQLPRTERMARALEWLRQEVSRGEIPARLASMEPGKAERVEVEGKEIYAVLICAETSAQLDKMEAHRRYYDIQYVHRGAEGLEWADIRDVEVLQEYDGEKDAAFYKRRAGAVTVRFAAGHVAFLFPEDAHTPGLMLERPERVEKIVVKVAVE